MMLRMAMAVVWAASFAAAQGVGQFEVASIRPHVVGPANDSSNTQMMPGGRLLCRNVTVKKLIRMAFVADDSQILNAPGWTDGESYDIDAKTAGGVEVTEKNISGLLLALLESRFQFRFHREMREKPVYLLEAGKDGVKLKEDAEEGRPSMT
jgi:uncharacterized protein (TIGR03435 family)